MIFDTFEQHRQELAALLAPTGENFRLTPAPREVADVTKGLFKNNFVA